MKNYLNCRSTSARALLALVLFTAGGCLVVKAASFRPEAASSAPQRTLTFADRVAYQRAVEEVYWLHRIWPKESPDRKPSLDAVMSQGQLEKKVADYLRKSQALEDYWQHPIKAEQLQAEMDRMAQHTKQPQVLQELFEALGNDPFVIAECLVRPALADRLLTSWYASDERIHGDLKQRAESELQAHSPGEVTLVGFGSHHGSVIAAQGWDEPYERMPVPNGRPGTWEDVLHGVDPANNLLIFDDDFGAQPDLVGWNLGDIYLRQLAQPLPQLAEPRLNELLPLERSLVLAVLAQITKLHRLSDFLRQHDVQLVRKSLRFL